jgi:hypothetical protein
MNVAVLVPVGTSPNKVAVVETVVIVLVVALEATVTVRVAVVAGVLAVAVADEVIVAVAVFVAGRHSRTALQGVPLSQFPADGHKLTNLVHWLGLASGGSIPPQVKLVRHAEASWQLQSLGQFSLPVQV